MEDKKKILGVIAIILIILAILFFVPIRNGGTVMTVENGQIAIGETDDGISGGGGNGGGNGDDGGEDNTDEGPCDYPSMNPPTRDWWFVGVRCPDNVKDFFTYAEELDCWDIDSIGDPWDYRSEITNWYNNHAINNGWDRRSVDSGYVSDSRESCWYWTALYKCEYEDKGLIAVFGFCPTVVAREGDGACGTTMGDWDYMEDRWQHIEVIIDSID